MWHLTSARYWAVGHMVATRYSLGPLSSHQNTAYRAKWCHWCKMAAAISILSSELTCLTDHQPTRSRALQVTANMTGTISKFYTAYQLIGTRVVPSVGLILLQRCMSVTRSIFCRIFASIWWTASVSQGSNATDWQNELFGDLILLCFWEKAIRSKLTIARNIKTFI